MLDIWISGIARAGGIEASLQHRQPEAVETSVRRTESSLRRGLRFIRGRLAVSEEKLLTPPAAGACTTA